MTFLFPWGLLGLLGLPILVWLWRWSASRHRTVVSSLIPFEHLLKRSPTRRIRPIVNLLFWLQAAAIGCLALSLARPALTQPPSSTVLVVLDTSASTAATLGGPSAFHRARDALLHRLARKGWRERFFIVTTAPLGPLLPEPTSDTWSLQQAVSLLEPAALDGNLSMAMRLGTALLGGAPDEVLVLTDEPLVDRLPSGVSLQSFGTPLPNIAIVGVETQASLCAISEPNVTVTVQNFSEDEQRIDVSIHSPGRALATRADTLAPQARVSVPLALSEATADPLEITVEAARDALAMDNHAWVRLQTSTTLPILLASSRPEVVQTLGRWLGACARLQWDTLPLDASLGARLAEALHRDPATILVTDQPQLLAQWTGPAIIFGTASRSPHLRATSWLVDHTHPLGEYLQPLETVAVVPSGLPAAGPDGVGGEPVAWSVVDGQRLPLVQAATRQGRRVVGLQFDPLSTSVNVQPAIIFLNSLRWLSGSLGFVTTGESVAVGPLDPGVVRLERPGGTVISLPHAGGTLSYDATDAPGRYRFHAAAGTSERLVNFINPVESNLQHRASTWQSDDRAAAARPAGQDRRRSREPVTGYVLALLLTVWTAEWLCYVRKRR